MIITVVIQHADMDLHERVHAAVSAVEGVDEFYIGLQTAEQYESDSDKRVRLACRSGDCHTSQ